MNNATVRVLTYADAQSSSFLVINW